MTEVSNPILSATVLRLVNCGVRVIACDADPERSQAVSKASAARATIATFRADLADRSEVDRLMDFAVTEFGQIDLLVNGPAVPPGISWPGAPRNQLMSTGARSLQRWINCVEAVVPLLERSGGGIVSVVTSAGRYRTGYFRPQNAILSSTPEALANGAILGLTRQLALELAPKRIRLNAVVVGLVEGSSEFERMTERERKFVLDEISLGRLGTPEEIAAVIAFLASDASNYVTGDAIDVNGGWWMS